MAPSLVIGAPTRQRTDASIRDYIAHLDGATVIEGGWLNRHYVQLGYQLADSVAGFAYSFGGTSIILFLMNLIPGLSLRASEEQEIIGIDDAEIGEFAVRPNLVLTYTHHSIGSKTDHELQYDYVELTREVVTDTGEVGSKYSVDQGHEKTYLPAKA